MLSNNLSSLHLILKFWYNFIHNYGFLVESRNLIFKKNFKKGKRLPIIKFFHEKSNEMKTSQNKIED